MKTYVVFHKKTGQILHTHTQAALEGEPLPMSREEVITQFQSRIAPVHLEDLDVLEATVELLRQGASSRNPVDIVVDVDTRCIVARPRKPPAQGPQDQSGSVQAP